MPNPNHIRALKNLSAPFFCSFWREAISPKIFSVQVTQVCISATFPKAKKNHSVFWRSEGRQYSVLSHHTYGNRMHKLRNIILVLLPPKLHEL